MAEKNQTTNEEHQKKTGLAGKKHWFDKKVLKRTTFDVVVTQNEKGTSEYSTASSEQHTDLFTTPTWSSEPWNTSVDQLTNQLKPLAAEGSDYNRLEENERQQMKESLDEEVSSDDSSESSLEYELRIERDHYKEQCEFKERKLQKERLRYKTKLEKYKLDCQQKNDHLESQLREELGLLEEKLKHTHEENDNLKKESEEIAMQAAERTKRLEEQLADKEQEVIKQTEANNQVQNLQVHIAKLKMKEQQQTEEMVKKNELIKELNKQMQTLNTENEQLYLSVKPKTISSPEHSVTKMKKEITSASSEIEQLNKQIKQIQQEAHTEKERMLTEINNLSNAIKQYQRELKKLKDVEQEYNKLTGEMSHKEIELQDMHDLLEEKGKTIQTLMESADEKSKIVDALRGQIAKVVQQLNDAIEAVNNKQIKIAELQENMEVQEFQMKAFKEDFERERADREGMSSKITSLEGQILTLQQSLDDERHEKETLLHEKESVKAKMEMESLQREELVAEWEEEKLVLTSQVNGYSRQCDELKKTLLQIQNKCKSLEDQLKHKTGLKTEINQLKSQLQHKVTEIEKLLVRCSETERNFKKSEVFVTQLQQELQSEYDYKQHLLSAFRQEQAKVANLENEMIKMRNANKILMENLAVDRNKEYLPFYQLKHEEEQEQLMFQLNELPVSPPYKYDSSHYDIPPQMNIEQMREFGRLHSQQREQHELTYESSNVTRNAELVSGTSKPVTSEPDTSDDIPENPLLEGIDQDIQYYAEEARQLAHPPNDTKESEVQDSLPYDPNLVCPKCGKQYRIGEIQRFKRHLEERCPNRSSSNIMSPSQNCSNEQIFSGASDIIPENPLLDSDIHYHAEEVRNMVRPPSDSSDEDSSDNNMPPYDPNLVCPKCGKRFRSGGIQRFKRHVEEHCPNRN